MHKVVFETKRSLLLPRATGTGARVALMEDDDIDIDVKKASSRFGSARTRTASPTMSYLSSDRSHEESSPDHARRVARVAGSPPSSLARIQIQRLSPSERAHEDAQRMKARWAKHNILPGPGAYDPKFANSSATNLTGSTSFRSKTDRNKTPPSSALNADLSDPGAYNPECNQLAAAAKASFQNSSKVGKNGFGSKLPREMPMSVAGADKDGGTPGPDTYNFDKCPVSRKKAMGTIDEGETVPTSPFKSATRKHTIVPQQDQPGPGKYYPNDAVSTPTLPGANMKANPISRVGRDASAGGADLASLQMNATSAIVGPGAYNNADHRSVRAEALKKFERMSRKAASDTPDARGSIGFDARLPARDLPFEKPIKKDSSQTPGPGAFNPGASDEVAAQAKKTCNSKMKAGTSGFASGTKLARIEGANPKDGRDLVFESLGDPGAYNPDENSGLSVQAKKSYQTSNKAGKGAFGSTPQSMTKRIMKLEVLGADIHGDGTPGPDTYNFDKCPVTIKKAMGAIDEGEQVPTSAFKSVTRKHTVVPQQDQPGPGAYRPSFEAAMAALPGANMKANPVSRVGRDSLAVADMSASPTEVIVGPGSYTPQTTNDGELDTIMLRSQLKADRGWGYAYVSDTIREMFTALLGRNDVTTALLQR